MLRRIAPLAAALALAGLTATAGAHVTPSLPAGDAATEGEHSPNLTHVANFGYESQHGAPKNFGTDIEFATIGANDYAFAGSYRNGMQIFDITDPRNARQVGRYDCDLKQGDVQIFRQPDEPGRVFATYTADYAAGPQSQCYQDQAAAAINEKGKGRLGTFIVDVSDPTAPKTVSFVEIPQGSHNMTVHPSGDYMYNSNSDLMTSILPAIEIVDIQDPAAPKVVGELALPTRPGLGTESHDITFNASGSRAYSAALSQGVIIDSSDPGKPVLKTSFLDPAINVWHQADPFAIRDKRGNVLREFLIVEDEFVGALGTGQCPNGGVHVYETTGALEDNPRKVGFWNIDDVGVTSNNDPGRGSDVLGTCTAHVFDIHEDEQILTIAYYNGGVRVVDLSGLEGVGLGDSAVVGSPMKELAYFRFPDSDTWSAKTPKIQGNGDFYLFGNDMARGLDVYRYEAGERASRSQGRWQTPEEHRRSQKGQERSGKSAPLDLIREGVAGEE